MAAFMRAIMQTAHHESVKAQSSISDLFTVFALRFSRALLPPAAEREASGAVGGGTFKTQFHWYSAEFLR